MIRPLLPRLAERVRYSYWFVPGLMVGAATALAFFMGWVDRNLGDGVVDEVGWLYTGGPEGARSLLSTVASSMITVAGVVFSITIVALTLAGSQFGPRLLRNFMRDRGNHITLGTFLATFVYCLLVTRAVRGGEAAEFVPNASVTMGVALALASLAVFIYFIHHAASSIQAPNVLASVASDLERSIRVLFPEELGEDTGEEEAGSLESRERRGATAVGAEASGYIQAIDDDAVMRLAEEHDLEVEIVRRPGDFVIADATIVRVAPPERCDESLTRRLQVAFTIAEQRTVEQDVGFAFEQFVSVCLRALSPGINDPLTAIQCIERLGDGLAMMAGRKMPSGWRLDATNRRRVLAHPITFVELLDATYGMIRPFACESADVAMRMLEMIECVAHHVRRPADRRALVMHARMIDRQAHDEVADAHDRVRVRRRFEAAMDALESRVSATSTDRPPRSWPRRAMS